MLPVFSVATEEEAKRLLVLACPTNGEGDYVAPELTKEQTLENLWAFGNRLRFLYERMNPMSDTPPKSDRPQAERPRASVWQAQWGDPADYNITDRQELDGYHVGEQVRVVEDNEEEGFFEGDEGLIVGISHTSGGTINRSDRDELIVHFPDFGEPTGISPEAVEPI